MRDYSSFSIQRKVYAHETYLDIVVDVLLKNDPLRAGFIQCIYFKESQNLTIEDIAVHFKFWRKGLGLLNISEVLKILREKNLDVKTAVAEGVGCYSQTPEIRAGVEAFWSSLGFKESEQDKWLEEWIVDGKTLETKLKEKL
jgi:hypothetical protein